MIIIGFSGALWIRVGINVNTCGQMFLGEFHHNLDIKNRIAIPAKFRSGLKDLAIITRGLDGSLAIYPHAAWKVVLEKLSNLSDYLKQSAGIRKKAVVIGLSDKIEVWSEEKWEKYRINTERNSNDIAEKLGDIETI
jgi:MraZ protein